MKPNVDCVHTLFVDLSLNQKTRTKDKRIVTPFSFEFLFFFLEVCFNDFFFVFFWWNKELFQWLKTREPKRLQFYRIQSFFVGLCLFRFCCLIFPPQYSMFFLICNILWRHNSKSFRDNSILKKSFWKILEVHFMMCNSQKKFTKIWTFWLMMKCWSKSAKILFFVVSHWTDLL